MLNNELELSIANGLREWLRENLILEVFDTRTNDEMIRISLRLRGDKYAFCDNTIDIGKQP